MIKYTTSILIRTARSQNLACPRNGGLFVYCYHNFWVVIIWTVRSWLLWRGRVCYPGNNWLQDGILFWECPHKYDKISRFLFSRRCPERVTVVSNRRVITILKRKSRFLFSCGWHVRMSKTSRRRYNILRERRLLKTSLTDISKSKIQPIYNTLNLYYWQIQMDIIQSWMIMAFHWLQDIGLYEFQQKYFPWPSHGIIGSCQSRLKRIAIVRVQRKES